MVEQIDTPVTHLSAEEAYDKNPVYEMLSAYFSEAGIVIRPDSDATSHSNNHPQRNRNILETKTNGRMYWQKQRQYSKHNLAELAIHTDAASCSLDLYLMTTP